MDRITWRGKSGFLQAWIIISSILFKFSHSPFKKLLQGNSLKISSHIVNKQLISCRKVYNYILDSKHISILIYTNLHFYSLLDQSYKTSLLSNLYFLTKTGKTRGKKVLVYWQMRTNVNYFSYTHNFKKWWTKSHLSQTPYRMAMISPNVLPTKGRVLVIISIWNKILYMPLLLKMFLD